jgi:hypothetical protein
MGLCKRSKLGWDGLHFPSPSIGITSEYETKAITHGVYAEPVQNLANRMTPSGLRSARLSWIGLLSKDRARPLEARS